MAINLWTSVGGGKSSYTAVDRTGTNASIGIGSFTLTFKARSVLGAGAILKVCDTNSDDINVSTPMTTQFKEYTYSFNSRTTQQLFLQDYPNGTSTIEVKDVVLVEKSTGKATINGVDGFLSGKWVINSQAKVIDDETLELTATAGDKISEIFIDCLPDTTYTFWNEVNTANRYYVAELDASGTKVAEKSFTVANVYNTFTTKSTTRQFNIKLYNPSITPTGTFLFKRPMFYLGSMQGIPYSKKTGDRMVKPIPTPKNNLLPSFKSGEWSFTAIHTVNSDTSVTAAYAGGHQVSAVVVPVKPNTRYVAVGDFDTNVARLRVGKMDGSIIGGSAVGNNIMRFTTPSDAYSVRLQFDNSITSGVSGVGTIRVENLVMEEASLITFGTDKLPVKSPSVNLLKTNVSDWAAKGNFSGAGGGTYDALDRISPKERLIEVKSGRKYTLSLGAEYQGIILDGATSSPSYANPLTFIPVEPKIRITIKRIDGAPISPNDIDKVQPILVEGASAKPFQPFKLANKLSDSGMLFDGVKSNLSIYGMPINTKAEFEATFKTSYPSSAHQMIIDQYNPNVMTGNNGYGYAIFVTDQGMLGFRYGRLSRTFTIPYDLRDGVKHSVRILKDGMILSVDLDGARIWDEILTEQYYASDNAVEEVTIGARRSSGNYTEMYFTGTIYSVKVTNLETGAVSDYKLDSLLIDSIAVSKGQKNMLPSFDSGKWTLNSRTRVIGKDTLELDANATNQWSKIFVDVEPNTTYTFAIGDISNPNSQVPIRFYAGDVRTWKATMTRGTAKYVTLTTDADTTRIEYEFSNGSTTGLTTFTRPVMYKASASDATIASVKQTLKQPARTLFAKR